MGKASGFEFHFFRVGIPHHILVRDLRNTVINYPVTGIVIVPPGVDVHPYVLTAQEPIAQRKIKWIVRTDKKRYGETVTQALMHPTFLKSLGKSPVPIPPASILHRRGANCPACQAAMDAPPASVQSLRNKLRDAPAKLQDHLLTVGVTEWAEDYVNGMVTS